MPISAATINLAKQRVESDIRNGFAERLSPSPVADPVFTIELEESPDPELGYAGLAEADAVATSESVVVVPWVYRCVHTGTFMEIPPTFVPFDLRGNDVRQRRTRRRPRVLDTAPLRRLSVRPA